MLQFHYRSIELAALSPEDLLQLGQLGLLSLLPLTNGGARREMVESMFSGRLSAKKIELVTIGYTLASLAFSRENSAEQDWLLRRFHEMHDILQETPIYPELLRHVLVKVSVAQSAEEAKQQLHALDEVDE